MHKATDIEKERPMSEPSAVLEFREASAAVRRAASIRDEAREAQILADNRMADAAANLIVAHARLAAADQALQSAAPEAPVPADIDVSLSNGFEPDAGLDTHAS